MFNSGRVLRLFVRLKTFLWRGFETRHVSIPTKTMTIPTRAYQFTYALLHCFLNNYFWCFRKSKKNQNIKFTNVISELFRPYHESRLHLSTKNPFTFLTSKSLSSTFDMTIINFLRTTTHSITKLHRRCFWNKLKINQS